MKHKLFAVPALVVALSLLAGASWAVPPPITISVLGNHWNPKPGSTTLCAQVSPPIPGIALEFTGESQFGIILGARFTRTNARGMASINTVWPQGIYGVRARIAKPGFSVNSETAVNGVIESPMVAIAVFNPKDFCGAQGGGALHLRSYGVPPNVRQTLAQREATYAFIYKSNEPWNFGVGYLDNDNPCGRITFKGTQWFDAKCDEVTSPEEFSSIEVMGMGWAEMGAWQGPVRYKFSADDYPGDNSFRLQLWSISGALLYQSAPDEQSPEQKVYEGKNVLAPCDDDGWPGTDDGCR
ncbi:MAG: hypothetical protein KBC96_03645 [Armatimonadetes bacterium]|nr:hypothetical protein [Armatimonadota bacterium]